MPTPPARSRLDRADSVFKAQAVDDQAEKTGRRHHEIPTAADGRQRGMRSVFDRPGALLYTVRPLTSPQ